MKAVEPVCDAEMKTGPMRQPLGPNRAKIRGMALSVLVSSLVRRITSSSRSSFAFSICLLAMTLVYRVQLTMGLFKSSVRPFDFKSSDHPVVFILAYLPYDLILVLICFLLSWLVSRLKYLFRDKGAFRVLEVSGLLSLHLVLILLLLIHGVHLRLLFGVQTGLGSSVIQEALSNISFAEVIRFVEIRDCLFLLLPFGLFWLVLLSPLPIRIWMLRISILLVITTALSAFAANQKANPAPAEIRLNPAVFLLSDVAENALNGYAAKERRGNRAGGDEARNQPSRSTYPDQMKPPESLPEKNNRQWNLVLFIMESVGSRYIFDISQGNPMPMPFLHRISKESWHLKKHYTTSNVSTKAVFSLLSGLYDFFSRETFSIRSDASVPSIYNFLPKGYDAFLVTPSSRSWYFPTAFIKNSGLPEVHSYENLKFEIKETFHSLGHYIARDEVQTVDFFIERLSRAREPFMGIYISFAAHFPYFDYGAEYRIVEEDGRLISRYYNNLNLLDHMIERIHDRLQKEGLLERTLFVIVGDHGQAFGQHHPDNYMHYRYSYNENLEAPAILYQPILFKPKAVEFPTNHVDLLPTLLDAMRISYDPGRFDGESLFHGMRERKPLFFYGLEECLSSLDADLIKVQYLLKKDRCRVFDLKLDPDEMSPLDCSSYPLRLGALRKFASDHDSNLVKYNAGLRRPSEKDIPAGINMSQR